MTILLLVRHGETEWNRSGRWQGHADVPLSAVGREQARRLAARLAAEAAPIHQIYASDLTRAFETATIIAEALGLPVHPLIELREMHVGSWSGLTSDEIKARFPEQWQLYTSNGDGPRGGHGETMEALRVRLRKVVDQLIADHPGERLLVVTHGGSIRAVLSYVEQLTGETANVGFENTSITELDWENSLPRIVRANDVAHLAETRAINRIAPR